MIGGMQGHSQGDAAWHREQLGHKTEEEEMTLTTGQKHLLKLIAKEQECPDGWAKVSKPVYPLLQAMPSELVELHPVGDEGRGRARLTPSGQSLIDAMAWL